MPAGGSATSDPLTNPQAWDVLIVAGVKSPGVIPKGGLKFARQYKWDKKEGKGQQGGTSTFVGKPLPDGAVKFQLWTVSQFQAWGKFLPLLKYDPVKRAPQAIQVYHPALADLDCTTIVIEEVSVVEQLDHLLWEVEVKFSEFSPPPAASAVATPKGAKDAPDGFDDAARGLSELGKKTQSYLAETTRLLNELGKP